MNLHILLQKLKHICVPGGKIALMTVIMEMNNVRKDINS